ncbi:MAG TPA: glycosyltransferase family 39 protein [Phycisphaerae bacterium]|nr:glycosyltransferase family 39 protein [Phycisphaerae bacterium]
MSSTRQPAADAGSFTRGDRVLLTLFALAVLLPGTFGVSLTDRDEGWYAQVSREMLQGGDWLIPHYLGQPWIAKPPLLYWCVAASFAVFGLHVWAARLISVLAMVGVVHLLGTLAGGLYNRRVALIACYSFITAGLPLVIGKMLLTDNVLLLCMLAAMVLLWQFATQRPTPGRAAAFWLCVGLAVLAKGPAVIVFGGAFALGLLLQPSARRRIFSARLWLLSPLFLLVAGPWYLYAALHAGGTLGQQFLGYEVVSRILGTPHGQGGPPGYYLLLSVAGWLPWTALVPGAVFELWQARRRDRAAWLLLIWFGLPWIFLELIHSKLPHYILPCYVPLAIMFGRMWDVGLAHVPTTAQRIVLWIWAIVPLLLGAALVAAATLGRAYAWSLATGVAGGALLLGFVVVARRVQRGRLWSAWRTAVGWTAAFHILIGLWVLPGFEPYRLSRTLANQANALSGPAATIAACGYDEPSMFFYLRRPGRVISTTQLADTLRESTAPVVVIARDAELRAAGLTPDERPGWHRIVGFNYVKGREETVWVIQSNRAEPR